MSSQQSVSQLDEAYKPYNGCILMAVNVTWLLYGCYLIQIYNYFISARSSRDYYLRFLVFAITLAGALHVGFATATQWGILVEHWGDASVWMSTPWSSALGPFTSGLNGFLVQLFFVSRIVKLGGKHTWAKMSAVAITLTSTLALAGSIAIMISFLRSGSNAFEVKDLKVVMRLWSVATVTCDVLIATTMSLIFLFVRKETTYRRARSMLVNLILQSIETGTVTAVTMLLFLICYETMPQNSVYMVWEFSSGPLYGNVFVFVLNSRNQHMRGKGVGDSASHPITLTSPSSILVSRDISCTSENTTDDSSREYPLSLSRYSGKYIVD